MIETRDEEHNQVFRELSLGGKVVAQYPHPVGAQSRSLSSDGKQYLYVQILSGELVLHDVRENVEREIFAPGQYERITQFAWSPDHNKVALVLTELKDRRLSSRICEGAKRYRPNIQHANSPLIVSCLDPSDIRDTPIAHLLIAPAFGSE